MSNASYIAFKSKAKYFANKFDISFTMTEKKCLFCVMLIQKGQSVQCILKRSLL